MNKIKRTLKDNTLMRYCIFIVFTAILLFISYMIITNIVTLVDWLGKHFSIFLGAISPLIIGIVLAYLISPIAATLNDKVILKLTKPKSDDMKEKKRLSRSKVISTLLSYLVILAVVIALLYLFMSLIIGEFIIGGIGSLIDSIVAYVDSAQHSLHSYLVQLQTTQFGGSITGIINSLATGLLDWWQNAFSITGIFSTVAALGGSIFSFVIGIIISIYLVLDKDFFIGLLKKTGRLIVSSDRADKIDHTLGEINGVLGSFIKGVCIDAVIVAILSSIALTIIGVDFAVFIGIFAGICNVIPYFGPIIGMIPAFLVGTFTDSLLQGVLAIVAFIIIQQIDGNFIYPRVVGSSTGLHPLFVLLAVTIFGSYGGLAGMILAVPIAGVITIFAKKWAEWAEEKKAAKAAITSDAE